LGKDGRVVIWDYATRKPEWIATWDDAVMWCLAITPDGTTLATTAGKTIRLWDVPALR
jgi:WD40 repeat protein